MGETGRRAAAVGAAVAVALAAGCGGSNRLSKSDYERKLKLAARELQLSGCSLAGEQGFVDLQTEKLNVIASSFGSLQEDFEKAADDIANLKPPKDAEADNQAIADTLSKVAESPARPRRRRRAATGRGFYRSFGKRCHCRRL